MKLNQLSDSDLRQHLAQINNLLAYLRPAHWLSLEQEQARLWDELQRRQFISTLPVKSKPIGRWDVVNH